MDHLAEQWSGRCGLAPVSMFAEENREDGVHHILLDGGLGSFAFSESNERLWRDPKAAAWAWSSGVPHHVTATEKEVAVVRWDKPGAEQFSRQSVESGLEAFYAYLVSDRVQSTRRVVDHLVEVFRRTRSLVQDTADDDASVRAYLSILATAVNRMGIAKPVVVPDMDLLNTLPSAAVDLLVSQAVSATGLPLGHGDVMLFPELAIRHAGSEIFQEAHFVLESTGNRDLFDWISPATSSKPTRGTSHFTPPALARTLVEQSLVELGNWSELSNLAILDPACGSGSFLYEAVRTARRAGFKGKLRLIGRDLSPAAVDMARFILAFAAQDWAPAGGIEIDVEVADALQAELPQVDVVLMNPPFVAWNMLTGIQRDHIRHILGDVAKGRVDLSMAFVARGLAAVRPGGVIGSVMPSSVLASSAADGWRDSIREQAHLRLIASLGEYGLFAHAAVNVAAVVAKKKSGSDLTDGRDVINVIGGKTPEATGDALRAIRHQGGMEATLTSRDRWQIFTVPQSTFDDAPTWRPLDPVLSKALSRSEGLGLTCPLGEKFEVLQGARTGWVKGFVLPEKVIGSFKPSERRYFRPAAMGDNILNGRLNVEDFVFFPYDVNGSLIGSETELAAKLPTYYERFLAPNREMLARRVTTAGREDWWTLARPRGWNTSRRPRIVSKYFGGIGGFALDPEGSFVVVQGFGWFLRDNNSPGALDVSDNIAETDNDDADLRFAEDASEAIAMSERDLLAAYLAVFNSAVFEKLLATFSSHVAGGQYDLSWRFVRNVPVPDFASLWRTEKHSPEIARLVDLGQNPDPEDHRWSRDVQRQLVGFYGSELFDLL